MKKTNILIAKFDGYARVVDDGGIQIYENKEGQMYDANGLKYHESWDWLMPIVEKIESELDKNNACKYNITIIQSFVEIIENHTSEIIVELDMDDKINAVYASVIAFIEWYNKFEKKDGNIRNEK